MAPPTPAELVRLLLAAVSDNWDMMRSVIERHPAMAKRAHNLTEDEIRSISDSPYANYFYTYEEGDGAFGYGLVVEDDLQARSLAESSHELDGLVYFGRNSDPVQFATISDVVVCMCANSSSTLLMSPDTE